MSATVFLDCETLGLDRIAPIWEFAALRIDDSGTEVAREHFQIRHDPSFWLDSLDEPFYLSNAVTLDFATNLELDEAASKIKEEVALLVAANDRMISDAGMVPEIVEFGAAP